MSKVRESKKKEERKSTLESYTQMKHLEESFNGLTQSHNTKLNNIKNSFKLLTEDVQKLQKELLQNQDIIKDLRDDIAVKNEELTKASKQQDMLSNENNNLKLNLLKIEKKFANLEVTYDQNVTNMDLETAKLKQDMENQAITHKKLAEEYAENCNKLEEALLEKSKSQAELSEKVKQLVHSLEEHKVLSSKKHEETITALKAEVADLTAQLTLKDEELVKINNEKREMEESKNKIIDDQTYKIREIERIFEQPLKRVQPQLNHHSISPQQVAPLPFSNQPVTSVAPSSISNSITLQANASRPDTRQSVRSTQNSHDADVSRRSTKRRQRERRLMPSPINEITDSDSDSVLSHHVPNFPVDINNNSRTTVAANSSPARGFGTLKRSYIQRRDIPETSESEINFPQLKRSRN